MVHYAATIVIGNDLAGQSSVTREKFAIQIDGSLVWFSKTCE
jgi:hypothetical protein